LSISQINNDAPLAQAGALSRAAVLSFGVFAYVLFLAIFLYLIGFLTNTVVPKTINSGTVASTLETLVVNLGILALFAVQHTIMARPAFKRWWTQIVPVAIERSIFVLLTNLILILLVWQWRPLPGVIWHITGAAGYIIYGIAALGWGIVLLSTFLIDHFDLFGLKQTFLYATGRDYRGAQFRERVLYKVVRHPLMLGFLIAFWATPYMTVGHLLFAATCTVYILIALKIEEATLIELHGEKYEDYKRRVRSLIPIPK
jgi:protein-S-isoprenylcysteine O-methyltransferase Ste14